MVVRKWIVLLVVVINKLLLVKVVHLVVGQMVVVLCNGVRRWETITIRSRRRSNRGWCHGVGRVAIYIVNRRGNGNRSKANATTNA